jgi:hypothetical protein
MDLIINSKFIGSQQTHRQKELHHMDLQETVVLKIKERDRKPSSYCLRTRRSTKNYSHIIGEAPMDMVKSSEMVSRLDLVVLELAATGIVFRRLFLGFWNIWVFIEERGSGGELRVGHHPSGRARPPWRSLVGGAHPGLPLRYFFGPSGVFWPRKIPQKVSLRLDSV